MADRGAVKHGWQTRAVWIAACAALSAYVVFSAAGRITHGFIAYYAAARLLVTGQLGPQVYDDAWFRKYIQDLTGSGVLEIFGPNPPTMALMATPFALVDHSTARILWLVASLACLVLAAAALVRFAAIDERTGVPAAVVALMLLNPSVFANLRMGQAYLFVFALFAGTAIGLLRKRDGLAGVFLGLGLVLKSGGVALLLLLIARRRWRAVGTALLVCAFGILLMAPWTDVRTWVVYPAYVREFVARPGSSVTAYQTTLGLVRHLCVADAVWNPSPAANCAPIAMVIPALLVATATVITVILSTRAPTRLWVAAGVCLSELALPVAAEPHFVSLAIPLVLVQPPRWTLFVFAGLFLIPLDYTAFRFTDGWAALAAYPRLYAAWLLWGVAIVAMRRVEKASADHAEDADPSGPQRA